MTKLTRSTQITDSAHADSSYKTATEIRIERAREWLTEQHQAKTYAKVPMADMVDGLAQLCAGFAQSEMYYGFGIKELIEEARDCVHLYREKSLEFSDIDALEWKANAAEKAMKGK